MAMSHPEVLRKIKQWNEDPVTEAGSDEAIRHLESCPECNQEFENRVVRPFVEARLDPEIRQFGWRAPVTDGDPDDDWITRLGRLLEPLLETTRAWAWASSQDPRSLLVDARGDHRWIPSDCGFVEASARFGEERPDDLVVYLRGDQGLIQERPLSLVYSRRVLTDRLEVFSYANQPLFRVDVNLCSLGLTRPDVFEITLSGAFRISLAQFLHDSHDMARHGADLARVLETAGVRGLWSGLFADHHEAAQELAPQLPGWVARWQERGSLHAWITRCCRNWLLDRRKARCREARSLDEAIETGHEPGASSARLETGDPVQDARLWQTIADLPRVQQQVLRLRYWSGLDYPAIGEKLGRPECTVRSDHHRAIVTLRQNLESAGAASAKRGR